MCIVHHIAWCLYTTCMFLHPNDHELCYTLSIHRSKMGCLTSIPFRQRAPRAPTSTTHLNSPSFPSTTLPHRTLCFFPLSSCSSSSPPTWSSSPLSYSASSAGRRKTTQTRLSSSDSGTPSRTSQHRRMPIRHRRAAVVRRRDPLL